MRDVCCLSEQLASAVSVCYPDIFLSRSAVLTLICKVVNSLKGLVRTTGRKMWRRAQGCWQAEQAATGLMRSAVKAAPPVAAPAPAAGAAEATAERRKRGANTSGAKIITGSQERPFCHDTGEWRGAQGYGQPKEAAPGPERPAAHTQAQAPVPPAPAPVAGAEKGGTGGRERSSETSSAGAQYEPETWKPGG